MRGHTHIITHRSLLKIVPTNSSVLMRQSYFFAIKDGSDVEFKQVLPFRLISFSKNCCCFFDCPLFSLTDHWSFSLLVSTVGWSVTQPHNSAHDLFFTSCLSPFSQPLMMAFKKEGKKGYYGNWVSTSKSFLQVGRINLVIKQTMFSLISIHRSLLNKFAPFRLPIRPMKPSFLFKLWFALCLLTSNIIVCINFDG